MMANYACADCGTPLTKKTAYWDDDARPLCEECYGVWYESTHCEECGYELENCVCDREELPPAPEFEEIPLYIPDFNGGEEAMVPYDYAVEENEDE